MPFRLSIHQDTVAGVALQEPVGVDPGQTIREAVARMREHGRGSVLVCRGGVLAGILTERDVVRLLASGADLDQPVAGHMSATPTTIGAGASIAAAIRTMREGGFRRLPILDETGRASRMIKVTDVIRYLVDYIPEAVYTLPPQPEPRTAEREGP